MIRATHRRIVPLALVWLAWSSAACSPPAPPAPESTDLRQRLELPAPQRDKVLLEMRLMLEAMNGILNGVTAGDTEAIEIAARGAGMAMAADVDPEIKSRLPEEFLKLGMGTHKAFDQLADSVAATGSIEDALRGLAKVTGNCVACHATYRLEEE